MLPPALRYTSRAEAETEALAGHLARLLPSGIVILLDGDLGSGKSVLARGVIRALGVTEEYITSPTFTLLNAYTDGPTPVYHFDLYRLSHPNELTVTGMTEYLQGGEGVVLIEWSEKGGTWIPTDYMRILLEYVPSHPEWRSLTLTAQGSLACQVLQAFGTTPLTNVDEPDQVRAGEWTKFSPK